jgi:hypothetical protein
LPSGRAINSQTEWSPEQISKLEEIVRNFITNAQDANSTARFHARADGPRQPQQRRSVAVKSRTVQNRADQEVTS